jgi:hypothetical protein
MRKGYSEINLLKTEKLYRPVQIQFLPHRKIKWLSIIKTNHLIMFRKEIVAYAENSMKSINKLCG